MYSDDQPLIHQVDVGRPEPGLPDYLDESPAASIGDARLVDYVAFNGSDYRALIDRLRWHHAEYNERTVPETHENQVFVKGPEGVRLEFLFETNKEK